MLALEFNKNPIINDDAAFDIFPPSVVALEPVLYFLTRSFQSDTP
jgi:hypothetical protein